MMNRAVITILLFLLSLCDAAVAQTGQELLLTGIDHVEKDDFATAMQYFTRSLEQAEQEGDSLTMIRSTGYIGNVYFNISDYARAARYMLKGYDMARHCGDKELEGRFLTNLVCAYCKMHDKNNAMHYYKLLEACPSKEDYNNYHYYLLYNHARIFTEQGLAQKAMLYHQKAYQWALDKHLGTNYELYQLCEMGKICMQQGQYDEAIGFAKKCLGQASDIDEPDLFTSVYKIMGDAYDLKGDKKLSNEYQHRYLSLSDSLFNRTKLSSADNELMEYESRQTDHHIDSLNNVITRQIIAIVAISTAVAVLLALSLTLYRYNRKLKMAHRTLIDKNRQLQKAENDKRKMLEQWVAEAKPDDDQAKNSAGMSQSQAKNLLAKIMKAMSDTKVIANPDFSLNSLAELVGSNTKYVSWVINDTYGKNFKTILNEQRIREACLRLQDTQRYGNMTIQAIYEEVGYTNAVSFIRAFKKVNGMTPSEYQKSISTSGY